MTSLTTHATTEADVQESKEEDLTIPATFQRDAAERIAEAGSIGELVKSVGVAG